MNRVWTDEELEILRRDREAKVPVPVTAAKLGRPVPATYARARLIGTLVQPHQSWDETSVARLRELVSADPPMTDKLIAADMGRTVTQIRWKMQDLGLIGVRDLSKLARITAAGTSRPKTARSQAQAVPKPVRQPALERGANADRVERRAPSAMPPDLQEPQPINVEMALSRALAALEASLAERLKNWVAESEAGMIRAARAVIAEKARIDQRLLVRVKRAAEAAARRDAEARKAEDDARRRAMEARQAAIEAKRAEAENAAETARRAREDQERREKPRAAAPKPTPAAAPRPIPKPKETDKKAPVLPAVRGVSQAAPVRPVTQAAAPAASKILVTEAPASVRLPEPEPANAQTSGRGGWKSVRRDPARALAQAKAKAKPANRADAIDLAQAAQAAIERFIAERGVTKTESSGLQAVVSRLQARGYIVVRDETGWTIDQRHRVDSESALFAFAEARGITLSAAA
ncbi:hypothetical protein KBI52_05320 [Microvirga sp. HBU67558]|uniref:hypothetical protein n=1 Tax=Microvirga TaxID=186650 RepID=UPI001B374645|nr:MULTISPECIES: hypothetical protein [unclassified Microvirga]MBQ0819639.1 hypothetical protein [Microvirga sp. HBU67558]